MEVKLEGDIEAVSVLGYIMRVKMKGIDNVKKVNVGGGVLRL